VGLAEAEPAEAVGLAPVPAVVLARPDSTARLT
jgi:hypothetical protein